VFDPFSFHEIDHCASSVRPGVVILVHKNMLLIQVSIDDVKVTFPPWWKAPHMVTPPPPAWTLGTMQSSLIGLILRTRIRPSIR
jgi:hypothetical protein